MDPQQVLLSPLAFEEREDDFRDTNVLEVEASLNQYMLEIRNSLGTRGSKAIIQNFLPDLIDILDIKKKQAFVALLVLKIQEEYFIDLSDLVNNYEINDDRSFLKFCEFLTFLEYRYVETFGKILSDFNLMSLKQNTKKEVEKKINIILQRLKMSDCPSSFMERIRFLPRDQLVELITKMISKYLMEIISEAIINREVRYG